MPCGQITSGQIQGGQVEKLELHSVDIKHLRQRNDIITSMLQDDKSVSGVKEVKLVERKLSRSLSQEPKRQERATWAKGGQNEEIEDMDNVESTEYGSCLDMGPRRGLS